MKKLLIFVLFVCVLALLAIQILSRTTHQEPAAKASPPPAWNAGSVRGTFAGLEVHEADPSHVQLIFYYDVDNSTDSDYQLAKGPGTVVMTRLKSNGSLSSDIAIELDHSVFVPARNRTRVSLQSTQSFSWPSGMQAGQIGPENEDKFRTLVAQQVGNFSGFVLFDQATHIQIELPGGWQQLQAPVAAAGLN
ncbi:MAG TPA: hypothetical protein VMQ17_04580 [Candidatus Sulfotelmatobacter sp.]|jgi:hypothetical protein|nr:hypothetical protein [Candidatus Sulfotelmatobacter sp.]